MDDDTTTGAPVESGGQSINGIPIDDQGMAVPVPDETDQAAPAVETNDDQEEQQTADEPDEGGAEEAPLPDTTDKKLQKYAESHGLELDSPNAIKAAKIAMQNQAEFQRSRQAAAELEKAAKITDEQITPNATPEQRDNIRVRNLELRYDIQDWKLRNQDKLTHEAEMVQVLSDPNKRLLVQEGYLSLDDVYAIARGSSSESAMKSQGGKEALQKLAHKQQAAVPRGNAVTSTSPGSKITAQNVDQMVAAMSPEEYRRRLPEINAAMG